MSQQPPVAVFCNLSSHKPRRVVKPSFYKQGLWNTKSHSEITQTGMDWTLSAPDFMSNLPSFLFSEKISLLFFPFPSYPFPPLSLLCSFSSLPVFLPSSLSKWTMLLWVQCKDFVFYYLLMGLCAAFCWRYVFFFRENTNPIIKLMSKLIFMKSIFWLLTHFLLREMMREN